MTTDRISVALRVQQDILDRADQLIPAINNIDTYSSITTVSRSTVMTIAALKSLVDHEDEAGITPLAPTDPNARPLPKASKGFQSKPKGWGEDLVGTSLRLPAYMVRRVDDLAIALTQDERWDVARPPARAELLRCLIGMGLTALCRELLGEPATLLANWDYTLFDPGTPPFT